MSPSRVRLACLGALLALGVGCVEDVWLGPERPLDAAASDGGGATPDASDDAGPVAALDAGTPDADADAGEPDADAGPAAQLRAYCGLEDCTEVALSTQPCGSTRMCWPSPTDNACVYTCEPAPRCGRADDEPCAADRFCLYTLADALCGTGTAGGFCAPYPSSCARAPRGAACGCDGVTYETECDAARIGGVSVAHRGPCVAAPTVSGDAGALDSGASDPTDAGGGNGGFVGN
jgi:hypothetical protein